MTVGRKAISARGIPLLKLIAAAGEKGLMLTKAEGHMAVTSGDAQIDTGVVDGDTVKVTLTDAGRKAIAPKVVTTFEIDDAVPLPVKQKAGAKRGSKYPFDKLNVGQSFHVPATVENPEPLTALASSLTGARRVFAKPVLGEDGKPVVETVTVNEYAVDAKGKRIKDADTNKWVVTGTKEVTRTKTEQERDFVAAAVGVDDPKGIGARVYRTK